MYADKYYAMNPYMDDVARMSPGEVVIQLQPAGLSGAVQNRVLSGLAEAAAPARASLLMVEKSMNTITALINVRNEDQGPYDQATIEVSGCSIRMCAGR